jgi:Flp pilus assembly protein TadG
MITLFGNRIRRRIADRGGDGERGSVLVWFVITTPVLLLLAVLLVDGGAKIQAGEQASRYSSEAARAASLAVGPSTADAPVDAAAGVQAAEAYLAAAGVRGAAWLTGPATVTVTVTVNRTGPISGVRFSITRTATARLLVGVETGQTP